MVIWKYRIELVDSQTVHFPAVRYFLHAGQQGTGPYGDLCLWFMVDPESAQVERTIRIYGTGHQIDKPEDELNYLASVVMGSGQLVWHVFEEK